MSITDTTMAACYSQPDVPPIKGPDAALFRLYRDLCLAEEQMIEADAKYVENRDGAASELGIAFDKAGASVRLARQRFVDCPTRTNAGRVLKLRYAIAGEIIEDATDEQSEIILSLISDLEGHSADTRFKTAA